MANGSVTQSKLKPAGDTADSKLASTARTVLFHLRRGDHLDPAGGHTCTSRMIGALQRDLEPYTAQRTEPEPDGPVIDLDALAWEQIEQAAAESKWIPSEYFANDWHADVCAFLRGDDDAQRAESGPGVTVPEGWQLVPKILPDALLGEAATAGVFETGNPKHGWDFLLSKLAAAPVCPKCIAELNTTP